MDISTPLSPASNVSTTETVLRHGQNGSDFSESHNGSMSATDFLSLSDPLWLPANLASRRVVRGICVLGVVATTLTLADTIATDMGYSIDW
eukprot:CAMPEP_0205921000 /NCGR_PEP_ID=MMETSP1325-20131115/12123_1 /ASSEMBLY_ACC=CAM_ASM_000708 /TAXON_ID=236786 /ORGANISM="Florenciella sp., Strain RCC1007" /LENGTH=90 /DNA_ID=CAMNT_0053288761 /DNA_START=59 /DNA_END=331 /DNA_ORIENTATION=-